MVYMALLLDLVIRLLRRRETAGYRIGGVEFSGTTLRSERTRQKTSEVAEQDTVSNEDDRLAARPRPRWQRRGIASLLTCCILQ